MNKWIYLIIISIASFLTPFTGASMNVIIPIIGVEFKVNPVILSWFSTAALLSSALLFLPIGVFGDKRGRLKIFKYGLIIFAASTLLASIASDEITFLILRFIQGCGSAAISVAGVALISDIFPAKMRGLALGINISSIYIGLTLGPFFGGLISSLIGWRYLFLIIFLVTLTAIYITYKYLDIRESIKPGKFDYIGSIILAITFTSLILGLSLYPSRLSLTLLAIFLITTILFLIWERRAETPLLDIGFIIRNRLLTLSIITSIMVYTASYGSSFLVSVYLQYVIGIGPFLTGLILISRPIVMALLSTFTGKLSDIIQPKYVVTIGVLLDTLAYILLSKLSIDIGFSYIISALALLGLGSAFFSSPNSNAIMGSVEKEYYGMASGLIGTARVYGQTFSMSIISLIFSIYLGEAVVSRINPIQLLSTINNIFIVFGVIAFLAVFPSILRGDLRR